MQYLVFVFFSFFLTFFLTPIFIDRLKKRGILSEDRNKPDKPKIPEMGGLVVIFSFTTSILLSLFWNNFSHLLDINQISSFLLSFFILAFIGIIDDLVSIPHRFKAFLPMLASIPLIVFYNYIPTIYFPIIGTINFGWLYPLLMALGITGASNSFNMLAGFNGFETGMAIIILLFISIFLFNNPTLFFLILTLISSLLAFLYYNRYKAKIFPGDTLTLVIGGSIALFSIMGKCEFFAALLMLPYILEFFIKLVHGLPGPHAFFSAMSLKNGKIYANKKFALVHYVLSFFNGLTEQDLVLYFYCFESMLGLLVLLLYFKF